MFSETKYNPTTPGCLRGVHPYHMEAHDKTGYSLANRKMSPCRNSSPPMGDAGLASPVWRIRLGQLTSSLLCPERLDVLHVKGQNQICKGTHLARCTNYICHRMEEAPLTRLPPIPGNNLGMEGQCCSWGWTSKPGKPQEQLVKGWRGRSTRIPQPNKTEPAAPVTTIGYSHPQ